MQPIAVAALFAALTASSWAAEPQRGVTDTEITIGTATDLSGVTAVQGVNSADAIRLAFDELNAAGGVNGRKIHYIVEDTQYQVPRAVQAINKLINNDNVFFTIEDGGTPMNNATFPMALEKNVPKLLPLSAARSMFEPFNRLKFSQYLFLCRPDPCRREVFRRAARQEGDLRDVSGYRLRQGCRGRRSAADRGDENAGCRHHRA